MIAIAGGIVLAVLILAVIGHLGQDEEGQFSFGVLLGNVFAIGLVLALIAAIAIGILVMMNK